MITFFIGLVILFVGAAVYGKICERVMKPDPSVETPAIRMADGSDYVPMSKWKNTLIELLNIAGTGPVLGPIQGILFGPIAFLTIPIGCVLGGALHDYMSGMISVRHDGEQMPNLIKRFLGSYIHKIYLVFVCLLMLLVGAVFIYTPGDLFVSQVLHGDASGFNPTVIAVYGVIFVYYLLATLMPIDKIIGKIYPLFGMILLLSAVGIFVGVVSEGMPLTEIWEESLFDNHPLGFHFMPLFFVTVACGIVSGFHSTQAALIARAVKNESEGRLIFYNSMIAEGFIAMSWAAAGMGVLNLHLLDEATFIKNAVSVVGFVAIHMLGTGFGTVAVFGVIILAITSGDTALRSLRLMIGEALHIDSTKKKNVLMLSSVIFIVVAGVLYIAKSDAAGFAVLWRYFAWANETIAVFAFAMISVYMIENDMPYLMALIPGSFYMYVVSSYILNAKIGFQLPWLVSYVIAGVLTVAYFVAVARTKKNLTINGNRLPATDFK